MDSAPIPSSLTITSKMRCVLVLICAWVTIAYAQNAKVTIDVSQPVHFVTPEYISFNFDWWPDSFFWPAWWHSSVENMTLSPDLVYLAKQLTPAHLRIGGTEGDIVVYQTPQSPICPPVPVPGNYCLTMERWDQINQFARESGATIAFGLNAMNGRKGPNDRMDTTNIREFLQYTSQKAEYANTIFGFEFGNELNLGNKVNPQPYAEDLKVVRGYIDEFWAHVPAQRRPRLVADDATPNPQHWEELMPLMEDSIDAATWHLYDGYGRDPNLPNLAWNLTFLQRTNSFADAQLAAAGSFVKKGGHVWVGETAMAYSSGQNGTTNTYISGPWWIYQLGTLARTHTTQCRQTLRGGMYELVDKYSGKPNPDWWTALIWKRTMGSGVLDTSSSDPELQAFAHCGAQAGVSVAFINLNPTQAITVTFDGVDSMVPRQEYHLTPVGAENSQVMALNGNTLSYENGSLSPVTPKIVTDASVPFVVEPHTYGFVVFPNAKSPC
eukprot:TRINITY_DN15705_c0_g1_i1.p1 TRINITY_DN15705_c0_g1~~TRINITY_DN15705_c0_g1_i1.p1  ORF type:complete len:495 (+),score=89.63 TRINITY_DN15705_c0_g1_i1:27-1511(+)